MSCRRRAVVGAWSTHWRGNPVAESLQLHLLYGYYNKGLEDQLVN